MLGQPNYSLLDQAVLVVNKAFDSHCYLVGSATVKRDWRDVDVRMILDDKRFLELFPMPHSDIWDGRMNAFWSLVCTGISKQLSQSTGLPVDFQIQSRTHATNLYRHKKRVPLGIFIRSIDPHSEGDIDS